jgi:hypothetical protein
MFFVFLFAGAILLAAFRKSTGEGITIAGALRMDRRGCTRSPSRQRLAVTGLDRKHEASLARGAAAEYRPAAQAY